MNHKKSILLIMLLWVAQLSAEPIIAILPFKGDHTVTPAQLEFITGEFTSVMVASKKFSVVDRNKMDFILAEQGFQNSGACEGSECKVKIGQLLGVDNMVYGNLVQFGSIYAFRIEYIDVATGKITHTVELTKKGKLEDIFSDICREGAKILIAKLGSGHASNDSLLVAPQLSQKPMSLKRKVALAMIAPAVGGGAWALYANSNGSDALTRYNQAWGQDVVAADAAYEDIQNAESQRTIGSGIAIGSVVVGLVLWFLPEGN